MTVLSKRGVAGNQQYSIIELDTAVNIRNRGLKPSRASWPGPTDEVRRKRRAEGIPPLIFLSASEQFKGMPKLYSRSVI